jgi:N-acetylmuramoyl-L-alanine amidase
VRRIDRIVVHCSATPNGKHFDVDTIRSWHAERGFKDIGYHFVIYTDGSVVPGRPLEKIGAHALGYNESSVGVCLVGGVGGPDKLNPGQYTQASGTGWLRWLGLSSRPSRAASFAATGIFRRTWTATGR